MRTVQVTASGEVKMELPPVGPPTRTYRPLPHVTEVTARPLAVPGSVCGVQLTPSGEVITLWVPPSVEAATNSPLPQQIVCHA